MLVYNKHLLFNMHGMNIKVKCAISETLKKLSETLKKLFETLKKFLQKVRIWDVALFRLVTDVPKDVVRLSNSRTT
jgi:hypothetical protein